MATRPEPEPAQQEEAQEDLGVTAVAVYDYAADEEGELSFTEGQRITHVDKVDEGWWSGRNAETGAEGLFPSNYVEEL
ncbi:SH3 domain-containing protein [Rhodotorula diobovata]|uniref:SH3 domain-containing protein n=1 Tax=Rhodotorula diobovata TaxID=5288 RepID=A0A5C5G2Q2_9BASI|nr:SH3 domain-containing protein [Rhodotorula diobovata]